MRILSCSQQEAEHVEFITEVLGFYLEPWQEKAILATLRAHKIGRQVAFAMPVKRK